jgi:methenyltetrahydromethanopterin cyclohydrolase
MYVEPSERHHTAHFHAYYQEHEAVFSVSPVASLVGSIPQRQQRLVEAWAELHQTELMADWDLLQDGRKPAPIAPLQ